MTMNNLKDVYTDQLQDLYSACKQSLEATNALGRAAEDKELSEALIDGSNGIAKGMDVLKSICAKHDLDPDEDPHFMIFQVSFKLCLFPLEVHQKIAKT